MAAQRPRSTGRFERLTTKAPGSAGGYLLRYGYRQRRTRNINAPFPGTPLPNEILALPQSERQEIIDQMRPFYPQVGNINQIESTGRSVRRTLRVQVRPRDSWELLGLELSGDLDYTYSRNDDDNDFNNPYVPLWGPSRREHSVRSSIGLRMPDESGLTNPLLRTLASATS